MGHGTDRSWVSPFLCDSYVTRKTGLCVPHGSLQGRSQDFSKGGSQCVKHYRQSFRHGIL